MNATARRSRDRCTVRLPFGRHRADVAALIPQREPIPVPLLEAAGLILAEPVRAAYPMPPFTNSAMDGFAVRAIDLRGATESDPVILSVAANIPAGCTALRRLAPGTAHRIMTGAPIPSGADAVVPVELTEAVGELVRFTAPVTRTHIRRAGEDVARGDIVLAAGQRIGAGQLAAAAGAGAAHLVVHPRLTAAIVTTGSELTRPGDPLEHGQIPDTNGVMLHEALRRAGAQVVRHLSVPDEPAQLAALLHQLEDGPERIDLLVTAGGISQGDREVVKDVLGASSEMSFREVLIRPGGPQGVGRYRGVPVVALPGNPVAAWVSFQVFLHDALRAAARLPPRARPCAELSGPLPAGSGRRTFWLGQLDATRGIVDPIRTASHYLGALGAANCLIEIADRFDGEVPAGTEVSVLRTGEDICSPGQP